MAAKEIPISELNVAQLTQLSQQLEQEVELLQNSLQSLKAIQMKFTECRESIEKINPDSKDILVPLTSSMYAPGKLTDVEHCLIDIGTGYYIEKKLPDATDYYKRKVELLTNQMEKVQPALQEKCAMKEVVIEMLQSKVQAQLAARQKMVAAASAKS